MATNPFDKSNGTATKARGGLAAVGSDGEPTSLDNSGSPFAMPPSGGGGDYRISEFLGELLLIQPLEEVTINTKIAPDSPAIRCNVIRLDNDNEQVDDLLVFQVALRNTLRKIMRGPNSWVIGRLELGEAKNGKSAPYQLSDKLTQEEVDNARKVMTHLGLG
jgi:hypothetical protein